MLRKVIDLLTSLKLTIVCLGAAMALIFAGTLAQVHLGIHEAQQRYFQSWTVWWPAEGPGFRIPIFPGGHLIGAVLLINLVAAHAKRFRWAWRKLGIHLTHAGLIIMLAGGLFTDLFAVESHMRLERGDTKNYSEDQRHMELAVIDTTDNDLDQVTAIPESVLKTNRTIDHWSLPFRLVVRNFYQNSRLKMLSEAGTSAQPIANQGPGAMIAVEPAPRTTGVDEHDVTSAAIEIMPNTGGSLGTWLVSDALGAPQTFSCGGRSWMITMRPARYYKPYSVTLQKFTHERYAGTEIPKNFSSRVTLIDPERSVNRDVLIYMNHPLRYRGETFYQAGFQPDDSATILQVVHNPSFIAPYLACVIVAAGLLVQFGYHLVGFSRRQRSALA
ncbi:MAG TPA: cytochrome c biogenesis protein ResB [Chthoniobacterales bacterium]|nr:cytochrome c biogenesis protein ResB [Chthoniobacterales bacterium]